MAAPQINARGPFNLQLTGPKGVGPSGLGSWRCGVWKLKEPAFPRGLRTQRHADTCGCTVRLGSARSILHLVARSNHFPAKIAFAARYLMICGFGWTPITKRNIFNSLQAQVAWSAYEEW
jgi:hypothetical protein